MRRRKRDDVADCGANTAAEGSAGERDAWLIAQLVDAQVDGGT